MATAANIPGDIRTERYIAVPLSIAARRDLTASAKLVFASIVNRLGRNDSAFPGVRRLADDCGMSVGAVLRSIKQLGTVGLLVIEQAGGKRLRNVYRLPSATETVALPKREQSRYRNGSASATETVAPALPKRERNYTSNYTSELHQQQQGVGGDSLGSAPSEQKPPSKRISRNSPLPHVNLLR